MRWNTMSGDVPRVSALADLLLGAALADRDYDEEEFVAVASTLMKVLGVVALPDEVQAHMRAFDPDALDIAAAVGRLGITSDRDKLALAKVVAKVIHADQVVHEAEKAYIHQVGRVLALADEEIAALL